MQPYTFREQLYDDFFHDFAHLYQLPGRIADGHVPLLQPDRLHRNVHRGGALMKMLRIALLVVLFTSAAYAQDTPPPVSLGGPAGVTGGLSLEGQNILTHMTDANYTMIAAGWWAGISTVWPFGSGFSTGAKKAK